MKNITITLDTETAAWLRIKAAEQNKSVSRFVGEVLQSEMRERSEYQRAMHHFLSRKPVKLFATGERPPTREEIHDRSRIR